MERYKDLLWLRATFKVCVPLRDNLINFRIHRCRGWRTQGFLLLRCHIEVMAYLLIKGRCGECIWQQIHKFGLRLDGVLSLLAYLLRWFHIVKRYYSRAFAIRRGQSPASVEQAKGLLNFPRCYLYGLTSTQRQFTLIAGLEIVDSLRVNRRGPVGRITSCLD